MSRTIRRILTKSGRLNGSYYSQCFLCHNSGCKRSRSHEAKDRSGELAAASILNTFGQVAFLKCIFQRFSTHLHRGETALLYNVVYTWYMSSTSLQGRDDLSVSQWAAAAAAAAAAAVVVVVVEVVLAVTVAAVTVVAGVTAVVVAATTVVVSVLFYSINTYG